MTEYEAEVAPDQPWPEDGTANVTPQQPYPSTSTVGLPLEHRDEGPITILKSEYPSGLVIIPNDTPPDQDPAILPREVSSEDSIEITNSRHIHWPTGIVALVTD
ncbi:MAG: hypothetical protein JSV43_02765 [Methanobacteriota archaeon]|nr:MAG: hypothetical protein JSV43_02765 [Euryarchaeota archaeon]